MQINTTARHFELATDDRQFAHARLEKFQRFARDIQEIHLVVTAEGYRHVAEITLTLKHRNLAIREEAAEPRRAIDLAADRLERQLRRVHDRRVDRQRSGPVPNGRDAAPPGAGEDEELDGLEEV